MSLAALGACVFLQALASPGCTPAAGVCRSNRVREANATACRLEMPPELGRDLYRREIQEALARVLAWFDENGLAVGRDEVVDSCVVFADLAAARRRLSRHFGIPEARIPDGFSGTVDGKTLFVVARETYARTYKRLYPDRPWSDRYYQ